MKLDLLSLRTLSAVQTAIGDINTKQTAAGKPLVEYAKIPLDDASTYAALNHGKSIGAFQLESPAQRALQTRLGAENIEDIVASIALIRPGPIKGNMVEPFIAHRNGHCSVSYIHPDLEPILAKTYGVVLFQEQIIEIAVKLAGFSPGEADQLRKAMTHFRSQKKMDQLGREFIAKATKRGVERKVAETLYSYIVSYAGYGFCEAHAAAFSDTAYKTAYLVTHYPAEFFAAILSHQPMGYYPPGTIVEEAKRRGVRILPPDVNKSDLRFAVENGAIRVSLTQVKGLSPDMARAVISSREQKLFESLSDFCRRVHLPRDVIKNLIQVGAFDNLHTNRRQLLWQLQGILAMSGENGQPALPFGAGDSETGQGLSDYSAFEKVIHEVTLLGFSPENHFMQFFRPKLIQRGIKNCGEISNGQVEGRVGVAGIVIRPHRPPTKSGRTVVFLSLEDGSVFATSPYLKMSTNDGRDLSFPCADGVGLRLAARKRSQCDRHPY